MPLFPASPIPTLPASITAQWKTIISQFDSGREQRRQKWVQPRFNMSLLYNLLEETDIRALWTFYMARKGSWEAFNVYDWLSATWTDLYIGTGDGTTLIFDIPGKTTSSQSIYLDGALQSSGYSILTGGGSDNADRVSFTVAPTVNQIITCTITGYLRITCRFAEDKMSREVFEAALYRTGLELTGLPI